MLLQYIKRFVIVATALLVAGCVHTVTLSTPLPPQISSMPLAKTNYTLDVGQIGDARPNVNPTFIFTADGLTQFGGLFPADYYTTGPLTDVVNQNLVSALVSAHYPVVTTNATYTLTGTVINISTELTPGTIYRNNLRTTIQMNLALFNNRTHSMVWNQSFSGTSVIYPDATPSDKDVRMAYEGAMNSITTQLVSSPSFMHALHGKAEVKKCHGARNCKLIF